jgi:hypothetical protein
VRRDVFVSYSQADRDCALELVAHVEAQNIGCWVAPRDIEPAADWAEAIIDAIAGARLMVLVFSASSNGSPQVRREVERAVHRQLGILPFRIEDVLPSKSLEYFLSSQHWLDAFPPPRERHYARLSAHLRTVLDPQGTPPGPRNADAPPAAPAFGAPFLEDIEATLATYIGPVAPLLVKRAAARSASAQELLSRLAEELDSSTDRSRFIETCRRLRQQSV